MWGIRPASWRIHSWTLKTLGLVSWCSECSVTSSYSNLFYIILLITIIFDIHNLCTANKEVSSLEFLIILIHSRPQDLLFDDGTNMSR